MAPYSRRDFLKTGAGAGAAALVLAGRRAEAAGPAAPGGPKAVSSGNGIRATEKAMEILRAGGDPLDAGVPDAGRDQPGEGAQKGETEEDQHRDPRDGVPANFTDHGEPPWLTIEMIS